MFAALDAVIAAELPQEKLYHRIGKIICERPEKGAAVAASEYLTAKYPDMTGFPHGMYAGCGTFTECMEALRIC